MASSASHPTGTGRGAARPAPVRSGAAVRADARFMAGYPLGADGAAAGGRPADAWAGRLDAAAASLNVDNLNVEIKAEGLVQRQVS
ncbi:hypothetical protein GCM10027168_13900 [Streptomyces capparidis]